MFIGFPFTEKQSQDINSALAGDDTPFTDLYCVEADENLAAVAKKMVSVTRDTCYLRRRYDGDIIGDCEDCHKRLGYNCPAAAYLRSKFGLFHVTLEDRRMVPCNTRNRSYKAQARGHRFGMYLGGLLKDGRVARKTPKMLEDDEEYLATLSLEQKMAAIEYLGLTLPSSHPKTAKRMTRSAEDKLCLQELVSFLYGTIKYRQERKQEASTVKKETEHTATKKNMA